MSPQEPCIPTRASKPLVDSYGGNETWFWGSSFRITGRKSYGHVASLEAAKVGFRAEYAAWRERQNGQDCRRDQCKS